MDNSVDSDSDLEIQLHALQNELEFEYYAEEEED